MAKQEETLNFPHFDLQFSLKDKQKMEDNISPFGNVWLSFANKSPELGAWTGKEEEEEDRGGDSVIVLVSRRGGVSTTDEENLIESETKRRKARPSNRKETANFTKTWWRLCSDERFKSILISFTILGDMSRLPRKSP